MEEGDGVWPPLNSAANRREDVVDGLLHLEDLVAVEIRHEEDLDHFAEVVPAVSRLALNRSLGQAVRDHEEEGDVRWFDFVAGGGEGGGCDGEQREKRCNDVFFHVCLALVKVFAYSRAYAFEQRRS